MHLILLPALLGLGVGAVAVFLRLGGIVAFLCMWAAFLLSLSLFGVQPIGLLASPGGLLILAIVGLSYLGMSRWAFQVRNSKH